MTITAPSIAAVKVLIGSSVDDATVTAYIEDATALVDGCPCIEAKLTAGTATTIVKYLAAHLYTLAKSGGAGVKTSSKLGDAAESWASGSLGTGLAATQFGQQALNFDTTGCLLRLGQKKVQFEVVSNTDAETPV